MEEILHQLKWRIYHYLQGFVHVKWCRISSINSIMEIQEIQKEFRGFEIGGEVRNTYN